MNERIKELAETALKDSMTHDGVYRPEGYANAVSKEFADKFAELIVRECAKELREAEREADRAFQTRELKERSKFDGYDFADMLEERFGVV
jgi:hypothetical protein